MPIQNGLDHNPEQQDRFRTQELALEQASRLESLGRLTSSVAHDFNNMLTVIQGNVAILRRKVKEPEAEPYLDAMHQAGEEAIKLVRQLLTFACGGVPQVSALDLCDAVDKSLAAVRELVGPNITVQCRRPSGPAHIEVCPVQLEAAILNLAANGRDAMAAGGALELAIRADLDFVELSVSDTGDGIPPDVLPRVLDPFFTTKAADKGTGLGLAQVHNLARGARGTIEIRSTVGRGTTVTLRLPRTLRQPERAETELEPQPNESERHRVLLVDDDVAVRTTVASFLCRSSFAVREAADAAEALALLEAEVIEAQQVDWRGTGQAA